MGDGIGDFAFWIAMGALALGFTIGPIGRALGRRIESRTSASGMSPDLEEHLAELDRLERRVAEAEERLDFAERMLAEQRRLPGVDTPPEAVSAAQ